jgi:hypothetical protein
MARLSGAGTVLAAWAVLAGSALGPAAAQAAPAFTFVNDPNPPLLPTGDRLAAIADVNGDGHPDLVLLDSSTRSIGVMPGDGAGGFGAASSVPVDGRPVAIEAADFNGDGHPDLLVELETAPAPRGNGALAEAVEVLTGDGHGGFTFGPRLALHEAGYVVVGDFTGDGRKDAAEVPGCWGRLAGESPVDNEKIYLLLGNGGGALSRGPATASAAHSCAWQVGDFNRDGRQDLETASLGSSTEPPRLVVRPGEPGGEFGAPIETIAPPRFSFPRGQPADLDGNGTLDLVAEGFTEPSSLFIAYGNGGGHFSFAGPFPSGGPHLSAQPVIGEFGRSGHQEIITIGLSISVMEPDGKGGLVAVALPSAGPGHGYGVLVADVNGDGRPDLILGDAGQLNVLLDEPALPRISSPRLSHRVWSEGRELARASRTAIPVGTTLSFSLNVPASVRIAFAQHLRRHAGRGHGHARSVSRGALAVAAHAGANRIRFDGVLAGGRRLPPGNYTMTVTAGNVTGSSRPVVLAFTVAAGRR